MSTVLRFNDLDNLEDAVYCVGLLEHLSNKEREELFKDVYCQLKVGGIFIISYSEVNRSDVSDRIFHKIEKIEIEKYTKNSDFTLVESSKIIDSIGREWYVEAYVK